MNNRFTPQALEALNGFYNLETKLFTLAPGLEVSFEELEEVQDILPIDTDSYKVSMAPQYPKGAKRVRTYIEARGGHYDRVQHLGVQPFCHDLAKPVTMRQVQIANVLWTIHGERFPLDMWEYIVNVHKGVAPIRVWSAAEGLVIPTRNVVAVVENTDEEMPNPVAIVTWAETRMLRATWYMSTVGTTSWHIKQLIKGWYETSVPEEEWAASLLFRLHDFGSRGTSSNQTSAIGGAAHLVNFLGTDTFAAIPFLIRHYYAKPSETAFSIAAMEHSTVTSWGREGEFDAYLNMVKCYANSDFPFAMVIDSYDPIAAVKWISDPDGPIVKILKERKAVCVLRPDSGDPAQLLPQLVSIVEHNVGSVKNRKGFNVLNHFRFIWGDGINQRTIDTILRRCTAMMGYAADNFAFGMGGALLQKVTRDDQMYAMKNSAIYIEGVGWRDVYKQPSTDIGKASKKGRVMLYKNKDGFLVNLTEDSSEAQGLECMLHETYANGEMKKEWTLPEVRANADIELQNAPSGHSVKVYAPLA